MGKMASRPELFYGWFIVAVTFFIAFVTIGVRNGFGVFVVPMENEFGWDRSTTSVVFFTATLMGGPQPAGPGAPLRQAGRPACDPLRHRPSRHLHGAA